MDLKKRYAQPFCSLDCSTWGLIEKHQPAMLDSNLPGYPSKECRRLVTDIYNGRDLFKIDGGSF
jgi:hypothetical protein